MFYTEYNIQDTDGCCTLRGHCSLASVWSRCSVRLLTCVTLCSRQQAVTAVTPLLLPEELLLPASSKYLYQHPPSVPASSARHAGAGAGPLPSPGHGCARGRGSAGRPLPRAGGGAGLLRQPRGVCAPRALLRPLLPPRPGPDMQAMLENVVKFWRKCSVSSTFAQENNE